MSLSKFGYGHCRSATIFAPLMILKQRTGLPMLAPEVRGLIPQAVGHKTLVD
jgi:hypothetical protein